MKRKKMRCEDLYVIEISYEINNNSFTNNEF